MHRIGLLRLIFRPRAFFNSVSFSMPRILNCYICTHLYTPITSTLGHGLGHGVQCKCMCISTLQVHCVACSVAGETNKMFSVPEKDCEVGLHLVHLDGTERLSVSINSHPNAF